MGTPTQPEEARIIDAAQKSAVPAMSMREAAKRAGMSDGRWRQIVKGYQGTGTGRIPVVAPDDTLARMALVVGVTDSQLEDAGRPGAADVLRRLLADSEQPDVELADVPIDRLLGEIRRRVTGVRHAAQPATPADPPAEAPRTPGTQNQKTRAGDKPATLNTDNQAGNVAPLRPRRRGRDFDADPIIAARKAADDRGPDDEDEGTRRRREQDEYGEEPQDHPNE